MIRWVSVSSILYSLLVWLLRLPVKFCHFIRQLLIDTFQCFNSSFSFVRIIIQPFSNIPFSLNSSSFTFIDCVMPLKSVSSIKGSPYVRKSDIENHVVQHFSYFSHSVTALAVVFIVSNQDIKSIFSF
jgi:hypothetical protein